MQLFRLCIGTSSQWYSSNLAFLFCPNTKNQRLKMMTGTNARVCAIAGFFLFLRFCLSICSFVCCFHTFFLFIVCLFVCLFPCWNSSFWWILDSFSVVQFFICLDVHQCMCISLQTDTKKNCNKKWRTTHDAFLVIPLFSIWVTKKLKKAKKKLVSLSTNIFAVYAVFIQSFYYSLSL